MNEDYNSSEPGTDLRLGLGLSEQRSQRTLTKKLGVGANAGSMVDMKYVTTDSLSELVWSPHKGLSLRCAESSFNDRKSSIIWDAEPKNGSYIIPLEAETHLKNISKSKDTLKRTCSDDASPMTAEVKMHTLERGMGSNAHETDSRVEFPAMCSKQNEDPQESGGVDIIEAAHIPGGEGSAFRNFKEDAGVLMAVQVHINRVNEVTMKRDELELDKMQHDLIAMDAVDGDSHEDNGSLTAGKNFLRPLDECKPSSSHPTILGELEPSAENNLQNMNDKTAEGEGSKIFIAETSHEVRGSNQQDDNNNCKDRGDSASPPNSRKHRKQRKGKEKALSDGDISVRMSIDEGNSFGSVESCSSAFFSTCKRRWSFEQQLVVGSKRVKMQDENTPGPTSNLSLDSSFMNWISNMMRGFSQSVQDEAPSLDLTVAKPDIKLGGPTEEPVAYKKSHDPGFNRTGFLSLFRSLYDPIMGGEEGRLNLNCQEKQEANEIEVINQSYDADATPIDCFGESDNFGKQLILINENVEFTSGEEPTPLIQPKNLSEVSCGSHQSHKTRSQVRRNSCNLVIGNKTGEVMPNSALCKCKSNSIENVDDLPSVKANYDTGNTSDPFRRLWITRFAAKTSGIMLDPENCNQNTKDDSQCPIPSSTRLIPCSQNLIDFRHSTEDLDTAVSKEQCYTFNTEASPGHEEFKTHNEKKSISKFNPILPSSRPGSSEAIASIFARRLGAFKHIIPLGVTENASHQTVTCSICGTRGDHLQDCSEITEREVKDLSRNISLCNEAGELPITASKGQQHSESCGSLADHCDTDDTRLNSGIGISPKSQVLEKRKMEAVASAQDGDDFNVKADLRIDFKVSKEVGSAVESIPKCVTSRISEISSKENEKVHFDSLVDKQNSNMLQLVINAVKKLRLSRNDILKCMNSHMSLSHLDGFFLRVRLGKWEEGLGGTGYHVACIRGKTPDTGSQLSKNSISVIVRGTECQVQSKYISNHDFLEDELMAWWVTASKDSSKILPLAADLRAKVKKKKQLGF